MTTRLLDEIEPTALAHVAGGQTPGWERLAERALRAKLRDPGYSLLNAGFELKQVPNTTERFQATRSSAVGREFYNLKSHGDAGWEILPRAQPPT